MSGLHADPALLAGLASKLRGASADLEGGASEPPETRAGAVTGAVDGAIAVLAEALGNAVVDVGALGDAVAESRAVYVETDYEQAVAFKAQQLQAEQPR
ncbi:hypothetical protein OOZ19_27730 [Saccharopolyspora sp. NFXS83]|uniref:hypothetical protein n=1 Tax=Saccharopolyspora sp. NFXS83 TaxID=2993560 RepID=UPI00224B465B|nr:hypothetical protein [Saccharopolyspora sp. NFXS83]MCX2734051.1 hypothetical protein [Saccharopolyspora sp. NFXS83]